MRIGIITQPLHNNYGGLLQNYALQQILKRMGHDVITIDFRLRASAWIIGASYIKTILLKIIGLGKDRIYIHILRKIEYNSVINRNVYSFREKYIEHTPKLLHPKSVRKVAEKLKLDAFIVGSDQVWRPIYNDIWLYTTFLDFTKTWSIKRIAYAASFGVDFWEFSRRQTCRCKKLIKLFDTVSVREVSGITLCRKYLGVDAIQVLDPTLLLDVEDYVKLVEQEHKQESSGKLFSYILDDSCEKQKLIARIAIQLDLPLFSVMQKKKATPETIKEDIEACVFPPVTQWLRGFMDAEFVITDSFHGTVFAIIFNKPFITITNSSRGTTRLYSLLNMFQLGGRLISSDVELTEEKLNLPICWEKVNHILKEKREESKRFLINSL